MFFGKWLKTTQGITEILKWHHLTLAQTTLPRNMFSLLYVFTVWSQELITADSKFKDAKDASLSLSGNVSSGDRGQGTPMPSLQSLKYVTENIMDTISEPKQQQKKETQKNKPKSSKTNTLHLPSGTDSAHLGSEAG